MRVFLLILTFIICQSGLIFSSNTKKVKEKPTGEEIFGSNKIHEIRIQFLQCQAWDSLVKIKIHKDSLSVSKYLQGNVEVDGMKFYSCGIRIKGESSYDFYPGNKKSLKINFGEFIKKQKLFGLKTINLNNGFKDPTFMREKLYLDFMREEGLPVPRCSYANVYLNNEHLGFYILVEEINKDFLKRNFNNQNGSFFKGEPNATFSYLGEDQLNYQYNYKNKSESQEAFVELMELVRSVNKFQNARLNGAPNLEDIFNVENCLRIFAINSLFLNVDAYNLLYPHNFYLYKNEETHKFEWLPYDGNYAFCAFSPIFTEREAQDLNVFYVHNKFENPLLRMLFANKEYREFYVSYIKRLLEGKFSEEKIAERIDKLAISIRSQVYFDEKKMYSNSEFEQNLHSTLGQKSDPGAFIPGLKDFVHHRIDAIRKQIEKLDEK